MSHDLLNTADQIIHLGNDDQKDIRDTPAFDLDATTSLSSGCTNLYSLKGTSFSEATMPPGLIRSWALSIVAKMVEVAPKRIETYPSSQDTYIKLSAIRSVKHFAASR